MTKTSQILVKGSLIGAFALLTTTAFAQWVPGPAGAQQGPGCPYASQQAQGYHYHHFKGQVPPCAQGQFAKGPKFSLEDRKNLMLGALNLTDAQKPAWTAYSAAIDGVHNLRGPKPQLDQNLDHQAFLQQRAERLQKSLEATQNLIKARADLLKVLTPEQVKVLDAMETRSHKGFKGPKGPKGPAPQGKPAVEQKTAL